MERARHSLSISIAKELGEERSGPRPALTWNIVKDGLSVTLTGRFFISIFKRDGRTGERASERVNGRMNEQASDRLQAFRLAKRGGK